MGRLAGEEVGPDNERSCVSMTEAERAVVWAAVTYCHCPAWRQLDVLKAAVNAFESDIDEMDRKDLLALVVSQRKEMDRLHIRLREEQSKYD